jgi:hypothetical protein
MQDRNAVLFTFVVCSNVEFECILLKNIEGNLRFIHQRHHHRLHLYDPPFPDNLRPQVRSVMIIRAVPDARLRFKPNGDPSKHVEMLSLVTCREIFTV